LLSVGPLFTSFHSQSCGKIPLLLLLSSSMVNEDLQFFITPNFCRSWSSSCRLSSVILAFLKRLPFPPQDPWFLLFNWCPTRTCAPFPYESATFPLRDDHTERPLPSLTTLPRRPPKYRPGLTPSSISRVIVPSLSLYALLVFHAQPAARPFTSSLIPPEGSTSKRAFHLCVSY